MQTGFLKNVRGKISFTWTRRWFSRLFSGGSLLPTGISNINIQRASREECSFEVLNKSKYLLVQKLWHKIQMLFGWGGYVPIDDEALVSSLEVLCCPLPFSNINIFYWHYMDPFIIWTWILTSFSLQKPGMRLSNRSDHNLIMMEDVFNRKISFQLFWFSLFIFPIANK